MDSVSIILFYNFYTDQLDEIYYQECRWISILDIMPIKNFTLQDDDDNFHIMKDICLLSLSFTSKICK